MLLFLCNLVVNSDVRDLKLGYFIYNLEIIIGKFMN